MINSVTLTGRLTRDPELRTTASGKLVCSFSIAVNKRFKDRDSQGEDAYFFDCSAWEKQAEYTCNYGGKGRLVGVTGELTTRKYTNKDGIEVKVTEIKAERVTMLDKPKDDAADRVMAKAPAAELDEYDPFADE